MAPVQRNAIHHQVGNSRSHKQPRAAPTRTRNSGLGTRNSGPTDPPERGRETGASFERRLNPDSGLEDPPESGREAGGSFERRLD